MKKIIKGAFTRFGTNCQKCGCVFEYGLEDVMEMIDDSFAVVCPSCQAATQHYGCDGHFREGHEEKKVEDVAEITEEDVLKYFNDFVATFREYLMIHAIPICGEGVTDEENQ